MSEKYHVILKKVPNSSDITEAHVEYDGFKSTGGSITGKLAYKSMFVNKEASIPKKATVRWILKNGKQYSKEIKVSEKLPHPFEGELIFLIDDNKVLFQWIERPISDDSKYIWRL